MTDAGGPPRPDPPQPPGWYADPWQRADYRWWSGSEWTDRTQQEPDEAEGEERPAVEVDDLERLLVLGGGILLAVAAFLPWIHMTAPFVGRISAPGIEGDGIITAGTGVAALFTAYPLFQRQPLSRGRAVAVLSLGGLAGLTAAYTVSNVYGGISQLDNMAIGQVGIGLWVTLAAAAATVAGALRALSSRERTAGPTD